MCSTCALKIFSTAAKCASVPRSRPASFARWIAKRCDLRKIDHGRMALKKLNLSGRQSLRLPFSQPCSRASLAAAAVARLAGAAIALIVAGFRSAALTQGLRHPAAAVLAAVVVPAGWLSTAGAGRFGWCADGLSRLLGWQLILTGRLIRPPSLNSCCDICFSVRIIYCGLRSILMECIIRGAADNLRGMSFSSMRVPAILDRLHSREIRWRFSKPGFNFSVSPTTSQDLIFAAIVFSLFRSVCLGVAPGYPRR